MNDTCCENKAVTLSQLRHRQAGILRIALGLNIGMFGIEFAAGLYADSTVLLADSLDMLGDAALYAVSLYAIGRGVAWELRTALIKAGVMGCLGALVLAQAILHTMTQALPHVETMGMIGALALWINVLCVALLWRYRTADLNMRSVWLCSRNDVLSNLFVLVAAWAVWLTKSPWPDLLIGAMIAGLFTHSALEVGRTALRELRWRRIQSFIPPCCSACRGLLISRMP
jgi:Co/Zn/Cd efflux system component